jgi:hypothetical protein
MTRSAERKGLKSDETMALKFKLFRDPSDLHLNADEGFLFTLWPTIEREKGGEQGIKDRPCPKNKT